MPPLSRRAVLGAVVAATAGCTTTRNVFSGVKVDWRSRTGEAPLVAPLSLVDGRIVVGARDGRITTIDSETGSIVGQTRVDDDLLAGPTVAHGRLYAAFNDVVALEPDSGDERWRTTLPGSVATAPPVPLPDDQVAVGLSDGTVVGLASETGTLRWRTSLVDGDLSTELDITSWNDVVYAGSRDVGLVSLAAVDGAVLWRGQTPTAALAATDAGLFTADRSLGAFDHNGTPRWTSETPNERCTAVHPTGDRSYVVGSRPDGPGFVCSYDIDGKRRWARKLTGGGTSMTPVLNGRFAVGVDGERPGVSRLSVDGDESWVYRTNTDVTAVTLGAERVFASTQGGRVLALHQ